MLLDGRTRSIANRVEDVLAALPSDVAAQASAETHACVLELKTAPHDVVADVAAELAALRPALDAVLREDLGMRAAADPGHDRQRRFAARLGLDGLVDRLADDFLRAPRAALATP